MSAGFTPGPWAAGPWIDSMGGHVYRVVKAANRNVSGVTVYGRRSDGTTGGQKLKGGGHARSVASEECDANANLIAAAPDLFEALLLWQAYDDQDEADFAQIGPMLLYARAIDATRAALAKARGEA